MRIFAFFALTFCLVACQTVTPAPSLAPTGAASPSPALTATPSPVPATSMPTATLAPAPRFFTEDFNGALPYWSMMQVDTGGNAAASTPDSGYLDFDLRAPDQWAYALYGARTYDDVHIEAQVEVRAGDDGSVGLLCRYDAKSGWYEFNIYADQTYTLLYGHWLADGVAQYLTMVRTTSEKIKTGSNEIGLLCEGDTLTPFINGVQMRKWPDTKYGLTKGNIGLLAASFVDVPFDAAFDWVKVSGP